MNPYPEENSAPMSTEPYRVRLDGLFEGPMDLLVHLIKKNELDITDIPIALITEQYLQYLEWMKALNIDFAGEFLVMASTLMQIKSRMLLPAQPDEEDEEDPREQITRPLLEYLQMKSAAEELTRRKLLGEDTFTRESPPRDLLDGQEEAFIQVGLFELIDAFQKILEKIPAEETMEFTADRLSVKDRISQLVEILEERGSITFLELFPEAPGKSEIIVTFLALLEMVKLSLVRIVQHAPSGVIRLFYQ